MALGLTYGLEEFALTTKLIRTSGNQSHNVGRVCQSHFATTGEVTMFDSLYASGPSADAPDELMLFGQFVGDWEFDVVNYLPDGSKQTGTGEWHFRWILGGHAIQDVWMVPSPAEQKRSGKPFTGYGTTVRFLDPKNAGRWHCVWNGIASGQVLQFSAGKVGDEIILERQSEDGIGRWIFDQVKPDTFHWRAVESKDQGKTWHLQQEFFVRRCQRD